MKIKPVGQPRGITPKSYNHLGRGHWFSLMIRITPTVCATRIAAFLETNRRDPYLQGVSSIFSIRVNQCLNITARQLL